MEFKFNTQGRGARIPVFPVSVPYYGLSALGGCTFEKGVSVNVSCAPGYSLQGYLSPIFKAWFDMPGIR